MENSMQLEKLDLLEQRLGRFVERFAKLKEENLSLHKRLEAQAARLEELETEVGLSRQERERLRDRLDRIIGVVEQLEQLQDGEAGESD